MEQADGLLTLDDTPLVVLTARHDAQGGWMAVQNDLARLSTNSTHRFLEATHAMLTEDNATAAKSSRAICDVVGAARSGQPLDAEGP